MPFGSGHLQKGFFWSNRSVVDEDVYAVELLKYHLPNPSNVVSLPDITHCDLGAHAMAPGLFGDRFTGAFIRRSIDNYVAAAVSHLQDDGPADISS